MSVNLFLLILYPFRKILYPKITSNFIAQTHLEIGREFFLLASTFPRLFTPPLHDINLPRKEKLSTPKRN